MLSLWRVGFACTDDLSWLGARAVRGLTPMLDLCGEWFVVRGGRVGASLISHSCCVPHCSKTVSYRSLSAVTTSTKQTNCTSALSLLIQRRPIQRRYEGAGECRAHNRVCTCPMHVVVDAFAVPSLLLSRHCWLHAMAHRADAVDVSRPWT